MIAVLADLEIAGRHWFDFATVVSLIVFFLVEMVLLFRNTRLGWAMTAKCLTLAVLFAWSLIDPPPIGARVILLVVLSYVIGVLLQMRLRRETVVVGREGANEHNARSL